MKRRELFWMLVPCFVFALLALWLRPHEIRRQTEADARREAAALKARTPFRLVVKSIRKVPLDAGDVADGYDTKVEMLLGHEGRTPPNWGEHQVGRFVSDGRVLLRRNQQFVRLIDTQGKQFKNNGIFTEINEYQKEHGAYQFCYRLRLRDVPRDYGELILRAEWFCQPGGSGYAVVGDKSFNYLRRTKVPSVSTQLRVRRANETIRPTQVSHDPQIEVREVIVRRMTAQEKLEFAGCDTKVEFHVFYRGQSQTPVSVDNAGEIYMKDATGKKYIIGTWWPGGWDERETLRHKYVPYYVNTNQIPRKNGAVTFHASLRAADHWPLKVQARVRPAQKSLPAKDNQ